MEVVPQLMINDTIVFHCKVGAVFFFKNISTVNNIINFKYLLQTVTLNITIKNLFGIIRLTMKYLTTRADR